MTIDDSFPGAIENCVAGLLRLLALPPSKREICIFPSSMARCQEAPIDIPRIVSAAAWKFFYANPDTKLARIQFAKSLRPGESSHVIQKQKGLNLPLEGINLS